MVHENKYALHLETDSNYSSVYGCCTFVGLFRQD